MRLTVLGASPACQNRGGACSGYLIEQDGAAVLIDCGSGVFSRLQQHVAPASLTAVIVSHMHADHTLDLIQFRYYLFFRALQGCKDAPVPLLLPVSAWRPRSPAAIERRPRCVGDLLH